MMNFKYVFFMAVVLSFAISKSTLAQSKNPKNYIWQYEGKKKQQNLGGYLTLDGLYHNLNDKGSMLLGAKAGLVWNSKWGVGIDGKALWYDHALSQVVQDGTYHLSAGMAGIFVSYMIPFQDNWRLNISLSSGTGVAMYQYDKDFRDGKPWYEEIIDRDTFSYMEPGIEIRRHLGNRWWLGAEVSFRSTSEIQLQELSSDFLSGINPGLSLSYGLF